MIIAQSYADRIPIPDYRTGVDWLTLWRYLSITEWMVMVTLLLLLVGLATYDPILRSEAPMRGGPLAVLLCLLLGAELGLIVRVIEIVIK